MTIHKEKEADKMKKEQTTATHHYTRKGLWTRILLVCLWLGILIGMVDGLGYFPVMADRLGVALTEILLWGLVLIPALPVAAYAKRLYRQRKDNKDKRSGKEQIVK